MFSRIIKKVQPSHLSTSKDRLRISGKITLQLRNSDLITTVLLIAAVILRIDVVLGIAFMNAHIVAIRSYEQKVTV